ncbi:type VII secretion protein EccB [Streptomyces sp. NPDC026673]|uniref:type VII secretion protein EccB n=1 Tax=Streptomyces sp. NPDC026673 TaxID=3155724 RepID=UPI0033F80804
MQSKREQIQAHSFMMSRLTAGMLLAEPDAPENPLSRTTRGTFIGILIGCLLCAGALVLGMLRPGGNASWKSPGTLVVNKETGARYLYAGGLLMPVRNYASARLIGGAELKTFSVGTASLEGTPIGPTVGIPGAPESVPTNGRLNDAPWQVCAVPEPTGPNQSGGRQTMRSTTVVAVDRASGTRGLSTTEALIVAGPDRETYVVWRGSRLKLDKKSGAAVSLGYGSVVPLPVSAAFLDTLALGPVLSPKTPPGLGEAGPRLNGAPSKVGQVFQIRLPGSAPQYYLLKREGLVSVTDSEAALELGDATVREKSYEGRTTQAAELDASSLKEHLAAGSEHAGPGSTLPASPPKAVTLPAESAVCAVVRPEARGPRVTVSLEAAGTLGRSVPKSADVRPACHRVDHVIVPSGHGALVRALGAGGSEVGNTTYLVSDTGAKYRVPTSAALTSLGYTPADVVALPSTLLNMLPTGMDLAPEAATGAERPRTTALTCGVER